MKLGYLQQVLDYTALQKKNLKYTIDEYDHFLCFLAAESGFSTGSRSFCISIENWKRNFEQEWTITMFDMLVNVFLDKESEKNIRIKLSCLFFDMLEVFIFNQKFYWLKRKLTKIKNLNILSENKWF